MQQNEIIIFTDGASKGNPGPGGWGAIIVSQKTINEIGGGEKNTTNNRMELTAAIRALEFAASSYKPIIYTDSSYLINGITKWVSGWKRNNWKTKTKDEVLNKDLWMHLDELTKDRSTEWRYIGGHIGIKGNERCDEIATAFALGEKIKLYQGLFSDYGIKNILDISHDNKKLVTKKTSSSRSSAKAYSYLSMVGGILKKHTTWADCEKRVKGIPGAKFKKALSVEEEKKIIDLWMNTSRQ